MKMLLRLSLLVLAVVRAQCCDINEMDVKLALKELQDKGFRIEEGKLIFVSNNTGALKFGAAGNPSSIYGVCFSNSSFLKN